MPRGEISDGQCGSGTGFSPKTSVSTCQYLCIIGPYSLSPRFLSWSVAQIGTLQNGMAVPGIGKRCIEQHIQSLFKRVK